MSKKIYLKNPIRLFIAFLLILVLSVFFILLFENPSEGNNIPEYSTILIAQGDTLWNIAKQYSDDNEDIRNKIYEIKKLNGINSDIKVGQELKIRIK